MATTPSLVDSNYDHQDEGKGEDTLVAYKGDDADMKEDAAKDNAGFTWGSPEKTPAPPPPASPPQGGFSSLAESRVGLQLHGLFPDPPTEKCNPKLQQKVNGFLERIKRGEVPTPVRHIRSTKNFNNPEILSEIVSQFEIVEHGTHLKPEIWNPYQFPREDYIDVLQLSGAPKPAAAAPVVKSTPPKEATTPTSTTPATPGAAKPTTIITRKSGASTSAGIPTMPQLMATRPTLADYARALAQQQQAFAAPGPK